MLDSVRGSHLVLLMGLACVVQAEADYCDNTYKSCYYGDETVTCSNIDEFPELPRGPNFPVLVIRILGGSITTITKYDLPSDLNFIQLDHLPLTNIRNNAFDLCATTLDAIYINNASFYRLPRALANLTVLRYLLIENTPIQHWDNATLQGVFRSLISLKLKNVNFSTWPSWVSHFSTLMDLDLSYNSIGFVPSDAFSSLTRSLTHLTLSATGLVSVPQPILLIPRLIRLVLNGNNFTDVFEMTRVSESPISRTLETIHMRSCGITQMANFSNFSSLSEINFSYNNISYIDNRTFPPSLKMLELSSNNLSYVPGDIATLPILATLNLADNPIRSARVGMFPHSLINLDLTNTSLTNFSTAFRNLFLLERLFLTNNPIITIAPSAFSDLESLNHLTLFNTLLTEYPMAFTLLSPQVDVQMSSRRSLNCSCPRNLALVRWYASHTGLVNNNAFCVNGPHINRYLTSYCINK